MADIQKSVSRAFQSSDAKINYNIVEKGSSSLLTGIYDAESDVAAGFYKKPDITGSGEETKLAVYYGEVMTTPYLVDAGVSSSTNDPASILKTYRFITGDGTNEGIPIGPNGTPLENVYIPDANGNPTPIIDSNGRPSLQNVVLASALGSAITSIPKIWDAIKGAAPATSQTKTVDPITGKPLASTTEKAATTVGSALALGQLSDVNDVNKAQDYALVYDPTQQKWVSKSINTLVGSVFSSTTICGGDGGAGGASGGAVNQAGPNCFSIATQRFQELKDLDYGFIDNTGASITLGTMKPHQYAPNGYPDSSVGDIIKTSLKSYLKNSNIDASAAGFTASASVTSATPVNSPGQTCQSTENLNIWIKYAGTNLLSDCDIAACGPCAIKAPLLQIRDSVAASTANIAGGTLSTISNTVTLPTVTAYFENFQTAAEGSPGSDVRAYLSRFSISSGGAGFYRPPQVEYAVNSGGSSINIRTFSAFAELTGDAVSNIPVPNEWNPWKNVSTTNITGWKALGYNGSRYVGVSSVAAAGLPNNAVVSTDGKIWNTYSIGEYRDWRGMAWNGTKFCTIFANSATPQRCAHSTNGTSWTVNNLPTAGTTTLGATIGGVARTLQGWQDIASNGSIFVVVGANDAASANKGCVTSSDGITWTVRNIPSPAGYVWTNVIWNGSIFCAIGYRNSGGERASATSSDGITWNFLNTATNATSPVPGGGLAYGSGKFISIAAGSLGTTNFATSTNGLNWTAATSGSGGSTNDLVINSLVYGSGKFVAVGEEIALGSNSMYSIDGITWTIPSSSNPDTAIYSVIWDGSVFRSVTNSSYTFISSDGITFAGYNIFDLPAAPTESVPYGLGYDYTTSTTNFSVPNQKKRLTFSSPLTSLDGVSLSNGNIVLLKDQTNKVQNGVYQKISDTVYDQVYELNSYEFTQNGNWTHVTGGTINSNTDWMLNSDTQAAYNLSDPQTWINVTTLDSCDSTGGGSGGGSPGSPGTCTTITTTPPPPPTITLANPCARGYGVKTTPPAFDKVTIPTITTTSGIASPTITVLYSVTDGDGVFSLAAAIPGTVTSTIGTRTIQFVGPNSDVMTASSQVRFQPADNSLADISYTVVITNNNGTKNGVGCTIIPQNLVVENSQSATGCINVDPTTSGGTGKVKITFNGKTLDLTNGFVSYITSPTVTAAAIASNINANVAIKTALDPTNAAWLPNFVATSSTNKITITAPAAGGSDFNGMTLSSEVTGGFLFSECSSTFLGGVTQNLTDFLKTSVPNWDKVSNVLLSIAGNTLGAVITNVIMNQVGQVQISIPTEEDVTVTFLYRGRKVTVPNEYNAAARTGHPTYAGWSGVWKTQWTQNPAWCLYDYITNKKYGLGNIIQLSPTQQTALLKDIFEIGLYCDNTVTDINGNPQPRFSLNTVITEGTRLQILEQLCSVFYGSYFFKNGGLRIGYDHYTTQIDFLVNQANAGEFTKAFSSASNFINKVRLTYVEPSNFYTEAVVVAEDTNSIETYGERAVDLVAFGCTDVSQATRYATWILQSELNNRIVINYDGGIDHYDLTPGNIIEFHDSNERINRRGGRIVSQSGVNVVLDANTTATAGQNFSLTLSDGTVHLTTIASVSGVNLVMASAPPVSALPWATYCAANTVQGRQLYKVIKVNETSNSIFSVTLQRYSLTKTY